MTEAAGRHMAAEIDEQPDLFAGLLAERAAIQRVGERIAEHRPRFALLAARGSSDHAALYAGLALAEVDAAELEIRRVYLNESGRDYLLAVARQHLTLAQLPDADGPGDDAEGYGKSGGLPL